MLIELDIRGQKPEGLTLDLGSSPKEPCKLSTEVTLETPIQPYTFK